MADVKIFWSPIPGVTQYEIQLKLASSGNWTVGITTTNTFYTLANMTNCETYDIRLVGYCNAGVPVYGPVWTQTINVGGCCIVYEFDLNITNNALQNDVTVGRTTSGNNNASRDYMDIWAGSGHTEYGIPTSEFNSRYMFSTLYNASPDTEFTAYTINRRNGTYVSTGDNSIIGMQSIGDVWSDFMTPPNAGDQLAIEVYANATGTGGGGCLLKGTQILMADGTTKNVEDLQVGDNVVSAIIDELDPNNESPTYVKTWTHPTITVTPSVSQVATVQRLEQPALYVFNNKLSASKSHVHFVHDGYNYLLRESWQIRRGWSLVLPDGSLEEIETIEPNVSSHEVYLVNTESLDAFVANGYLTHNKEPIQDV